MSIFSSSTTSNPPGPGWSPIQTAVSAFRGDRLEFLTRMARKYGDVVSMRIGFEHIFLVSDPELIREVLVTSHKNFLKGRGLERVKRLLRQGLLTSEGEFHLRQRRMIQPAFHRDRIHSFAAQMIAETDRMMAGWQHGQELDIAQEMGDLTLRIVGKTLFGSDVEAVAKEVSGALNALMDSFYLTMLPCPGFIERLPLPLVRRMIAGRKRLDEIIYGMIDTRRNAERSESDLLSMLLDAQDLEGDGGGMSDEQVRDEAMTIFLAGHETTANALTWTWYLLAKHPEVEWQLQEEVDRVLDGRSPTAADFPALSYVEKVMTESMRLYPPAWIVVRRAVKEQLLGRYTLPAKTLVMTSQWVVHHDPRFFPEPSRFNPGRWTPEFRASLPKFAYFPFGGGPRQCIGEGFAWMETVLLIASISQRWRLALLPGQHVVPEPVVTLRTKGGVNVRLIERKSDPRNGAATATPRDNFNR